MKRCATDSVAPLPELTGSLNVANTTKSPCTGPVASLVRVTVKGGTTV